MEKNRVKYYGASDLIYGYMVDKSIEVLKELDKKNDTYTLNDILELYNIYKYAENGLFPKKISEEDKKFFNEDHRLKIHRIIGTYVAKICDRNVEILTQNLYSQYNEDFWSIIVKYIVIKINDEFCEKIYSVT